MIELRLLHRFECPVVNGAMPSGIVIDARFVQPSNALPQILVTLSAIIISMMFVQHHVLTNFCDAIWNSDRG